MPDDRPRESADLTDYEVLDASDTLDGPPGDDPLDRGVATPDRWSAGIRRGLADSGEESLDEQLAEEEPDTGYDPGGESADDIGGDENATEDDVARRLRAEGPDPRAGRLGAADDASIEDDEVSLATQDELVARDEGVDGGGASAEEAAVHVVDEDTASSDRP